jgi:hypothetical protein
MKKSTQCRAVALCGSSRAANTRPFDGEGTTKCGAWGRKLAREIPHAAAAPGRLRQTLESDVAQRGSYTRTFLNCHGSDLSMSSGNRLSRSVSGVQSVYAPTSFPRYGVQISMARR